MPLTFDDDETSAASSRPIELYALASPTTVYRVTSHPVNVSYGGNTYEALTMSRGATELAQDLTAREFMVYLPITHPIVQRFAAFGIPERELIVTVLRLQERSGIAVGMQTGYATGLSIDGHVAILRVPSLNDDAIKIRLPVIAAQQLCTHMLFDSGCAPNPDGFDGPSRATFSVATTLASQAASTIVIGSMGSNPDGWATYGEIVHVGSGERRLILSQVGTTLTVNVPFQVVSGGDPVVVYAGCDLNPSTCRFKFSNMGNYGGMPYMNSALNYWSPAGLGVVVQT